jgi:hypothetical protein
VLEGDPQATANTAWACATLGHNISALFQAIDHRGAWLVANGTSQTIANTAWACAKLGHASSELFNALDNDTRAEWLVTHGQAQEIANTACACARLKHVSPNLFAAISTHWNWLLPKCNKQDLDGILWAFQKLGHAVPTLSKDSRVEP